MIGNGLRDLIFVDEVRRLAHFAVRRVDEGDARLIEELLERQRLAAVGLDLVPVGLDALESERGDSLDRPSDIVLSAPEGARGPEKNVRIDGVERAMRNGAPHAGWSDETRGSSHATERHRV